MASIYKGELAKKLPRPDDGRTTEALLLGDHTMFNQLISAEVHRKLDKLPMLLKHFEIEFDKTDPSSLLLAYYRLSLCLAEQHVPGFQVEGRRGRPKSWTPALRAKASRALAQLAQEWPNVTRTKLASRLVKQDPWKSLSRSGPALLKQISLLEGPLGWFWPGKK